MPNAVLIQTLQVFRKCLWLFRRPLFKLQAAHMLALRYIKRLGIVNRTGNPTVVLSYICTDLSYGLDSSPAPGRNLRPIDLVKSAYIPDLATCPFSFDSITPYIQLLLLSASNNHVITCWYWCCIPEYIIGGFYIRMSVCVLNIQHLYLYFLNTPSPSIY